MALDFPATPAINQPFTTPNGITYVWDGITWNAYGSLRATARQGNLIVNPAMAISQENGSTAGNLSTWYPVDQWPVFTTGPVYSSQRIASLTPDGNPNRIRKTITTPKASLAAGDVCSFTQYMEGVRIVSLGYGAATALQSVLRFGFKGAAGTYSFTLRNSGSTRSYVKNFTITAAQANTDTIQTFVIPGDNTGTWLADNSIGMSLSICDAVGTTYQGVEGWQAGNFFGTAANTNQVATNGNVIELFDVGIYADPDKTGLAPPFVAPQYSDALVDCQRYWQPLPYLNLNGYGLASNIESTTVSLMCSMRVQPVIAAPTFSYSNCSGGTMNAQNNNAVRYRATITATTQFQLDTSGGSASARM